MVTIDSGNFLMLLVTCVMVSTIMLSNNHKMKLLMVLLISVMHMTVAQTVKMPADKEFTNSIGIEFVRIEPGTFMKGFWRRHTFGEDSQCTGSSFHQEYRPGSLRTER